MNTITKARLFQGLIFLVVFLLVWLLTDVLLNDNLLEYRAGIVGIISAATAGILTPKIKTIESQSGPKVQVTSIFIRGAKFFN